MIGWRAKWRRIRRICFKNLDTTINFLLLASFIIWGFGKASNLSSIVTMSAYFSLTLLAFLAGVFFQKVIITEHALAEIKENMQNTEKRLNEVESKLIRV